ncbi:hypothetical protein BC941DRAFT_358060 [Chlamydoabsidia padenii]|nr:hypothetical protein BC941DRAFT_358060 [Chlamydoabsidia padenii]
MKRRLNIRHITRDKGKDVSLLLCPLPHLCLHYTLFIYPHIIFFIHKTTFSRMETAMEDAFVGWFNTFECKSHPIDTITELSDGIMLSDVLTDVDGKWFKQIPNDTHLTWVQRLHNQALIYKLIRHYFEQVLGQDPGLLPTVNLEAIAKNADLHELLVMCQLVIAIAVQSDNNRMYIEMIQNLPQKNQQVLMVSIEKVMRHFDGDDMNPQFSQINGLTASRNFYTDSDLLLASQFENVLTVRKQLKQSHIQLLVTYNDLRTRFVSRQSDTLMKS